MNRRHNQKGRFLKFFISFSFLSYPEYQSHHFMANRKGKSGSSDKFYFGGLQNHCRQGLQPLKYKTRTPWKQSYDKPQFSSVPQSCPTPCDPMDCSTPGFPVHHQLPEPTQAHVHHVTDAPNHLILCRPLLLPASIFPSIRVFSNELVLCIRWPNYQSFSFSISPSMNIQV